MKCLLLVILSVVLLKQQSRAENWLFKEGKSLYDIVLPRDASKTEQTAASEFQQIISNISGVRLPICLEDSMKQGKHVYIGFCNATAINLNVQRPASNEETYCYQTKDDNLFIYGGSNRGTMYGVFSFLERELGVHWYTSSYTKIPKMRKFLLRPLRRHEKPAIHQRLEFYYDALRHDEWAAHNLLNTQYSLSDTKYGSMTAYWGIHTFEILLPPSVYFKNHPEFFSVYNGKRSDKAQLCLSNHAMRLELTKNLKETIDKNPGYWCYDVSQNDNQNPCECTDCMRLVKRYGGHSGAMLWFVNQVAHDIKKIHPYIFVGTFAYQYTRQAPTSNIQPADNVVIRLCDIECCMGHSLETCEMNSSFMNDLKKWRRIAKNIYIWDYTTGFSNYLLPFPNFDVLAVNYRLFDRSEVIGVMEEGAHNAPWNEFSELKQWMIAKLLWNPYQDTDSLARLFIKDYYGKASHYVWKYYQLCKNQVKPNSHFSVTIDWQSEIYGDKFISNSLALMNKAQKAIEKDKVLTERINRLRAQLLYLKLRRNPALSAIDGTLNTFKEIVKADETLIRENNYKLDDLLKDLKYY